MSQILVFGDSIAYGASDIDGGWTARLRKFLDGMANEDENYYYLIYNLGVSGNNSSELLKRFESEATQRIKEEGETIIIFAIGTNDSQLFAGKLRTEPEQFKANLELLNSLAKKYSQKVAFIGLTSVDEAKTAPVTWHKDKFYTNENLSKTNQIIKEFCQQNKLLFVDLFDVLNMDDLEDGLHPNTVGHQKMFEVIKDELMKNKII